MAAVTAQVFQIIRATDFGKSGCPAFRGWCASGTDRLVRTGRTPSVKRPNTRFPKSNTRPLKKEKDFKRSIGKAVECKLYKAIDKQKEFEGVLKDFTEDTVTIEIDEKDLVLDRKDIAMIRLAIEF